MIPRSLKCFNLDEKFQKNNSVQFSLLHSFLKFHNNDKMKLNISCAIKRKYRIIQGESLVLAD